MRGSCRVLARPPPSWRDVARDCSYPAAWVKSRTHSVLCAPTSVRQRRSVWSSFGSVSAEDFTFFDTWGGGAGEEFFGFAVLALAALVGRFFVGSDFLIEVFEEPGCRLPGAAGFANDAGQRLELGLKAGGGDVFAEGGGGFWGLFGGGVGG